nr:alpha/beta hydrolase [Bradyrhizobium sp.]
MGDDVGREAFVRQQPALMSRPDSRPTLAWIKCLMLVPSSDEDGTVPNSLSSEMAGAKLIIIPDCGHLTPLEQPKATAAALVEWLRI